MVNAFLHSVVPLLFSFLIPYANSIKTFRSKLISGIIRHFSKVSYSMYLLHFSLLVPYFYRLQVSSMADGIAQYILYWLVVISLSSLLYTYFEYPLMQLRENFGKANKRKVDMAP
jgi:peptidoglycan/LPS O-acetylase OafA/YrhL